MAKIKEKTAIKSKPKNGFSKNKNKNSSKKQSLNLNDKVSALKKELTSSIKITKKNSDKNSKKINDNKISSQKINKKDLSKKTETKNKPLKTNSFKKQNIKSKGKLPSFKVKDLSSINREVVINNKKFIIPKNHDFHNYVCVWRMYLLTNPKTKKQYVKKFWIVMGEGHTQYRKFETQQEAIDYFRNLKKFAKMKVQAARSQEFKRTVFTFFEMIYKGLDVVDVESNTKEIQAALLNHKLLNQELEENKDEYQDEYTKYDLYIDEETNSLPINNNEIDNSEIDKLILEKEGQDTVLLDQNEIDQYEEEMKNAGLPSQDSIESYKSLYETVQREILYSPENDEKNKTKTYQLLIENDDEEQQSEKWNIDSASTKTYSFATKTYQFINDEIKANNEIDNNQTENEAKTKTYSFATKTYQLDRGKLYSEDEMVDNNEKTVLYDIASTLDNRNKDDEEIEIDIVQHNTDLNKLNSKEVKNQNKKTKKPKSKKPLLITLSILLSLAALIILILILLDVFNVFKTFNINIQ